MRRGARWAVISGCALITVFACARVVPSAAPIPQLARDSIIHVTLLQLNDVYEIAPLDAGRAGGLARVATIRKRLLALNPHTYTVLAGDFFSPSAIGTAPFEGGRLDGKQMVAVLNGVGLDFATFGNHEFDIDAGAFAERLHESRFAWVSSNVFDSLGTPFPGVALHRILRVDDGGGRVFRIGLVGATIVASRPTYERYTDPLGAIREQARAIRDSVDILVALTHLALAQDKELVEAVPDIDLVLGGHEHENWRIERGQDFTPILKADANTRSVYVIELTFDPIQRRHRMSPRLVHVTDSIPEDSTTAREVTRWLDIAFQGFRGAGFEPTQEVATVPIALDGRESEVRNGSTALTKLIGDAMLHESAGSELAIYNSGSIRIDDVVPPGRLTQYDVIRMLPFGGKVLSVEMRGRLLSRVLAQGLRNVGKGGFLQVIGAAQDGRGDWIVQGQPIAADRWYKVAINEFLVSGREAGLDFLNRQSVDLRDIRELRDIRIAVIDELRRRFR